MPPQLKPILRASALALFSKARPGASNRASMSRQAFANSTPGSSTSTT
jgi:hypothetical protein